jgi:hypothetical protein
MFQGQKALSRLEKRIYQICSEATEESGLTRPPFVSRALEKDLASRYKTMDDLLIDMTRVRKEPSFHLTDTKKYRILNNE